MAIFASTTTSGYSDPLKAMTIKALEARQKDLLAQQAADKPDAAMMATIPGGIGHVLGQVGDMMQQRRADQALASQRDVLSKAITGYNPDSGPPPAAVAATDPELYKSLLQTWAENRRAAATDTTTRRGQDTSLQGIQGTNQTSLATNTATNTTSAANTQATVAGEAARLQTKIEADKAAAAEAAKATATEKRAEETAKEEAAKAAFERTKSLPQTELEKLTQSLGRKPTEEEVKASIEKLTRNPPSEDKLVIEERNKAVEYQSTLKQLDRAFDLISSPKGIHSGSAVGTPLKTGIGTVWPQSLGGPDDETQANTMEFNRIMKSQGLQNLLQMKGASSDRDVNLNLEIANDPKEPLERRKTALAFVRDRMYTHVQANKEDIKRLSGSYPDLQSAPGSKPAAAAAAPDQNAAAKAWLANPANKTSPDYEAVRQKVEGGK